MNIIHIILGKANPNRMNGVNKIVHQLACAQVRLGNEVTVLGITNDITKTANRPYKLILIQKSSVPFFVSKSLQEILDRISVDTIIHFHGVLIPVFFSISYLLRKLGLSYVVTIHGNLQRASLKNKRLFKLLYISIFEKSFLRNASNVQAITSHEKNEIDRLIKIKSILIANAYSGKESQITGSQNKEVIFGYMGRIKIDHKGLDTLIRAFSQFYTQYKMGYLWFIGNGPDMAALRNLAKKYSLKERVIFHGECHGSEKEFLLHKIDIFVSPSRWDVLPTAILEAAAFGKPLIVSNQTGFASAIKQWSCGITIESDDDKTLAKALTEIMLKSPNELMSIGRNAQNMVKEEFNWSMIAHKILNDLYRHPSK